jgi:hypothetical protein
VTLVAASVPCTFVIGIIFSFGALLRQLVCEPLSFMCIHSAQLVDDLVCVGMFMDIDKDQST